MTTLRSLRTRHRTDPWIRTAGQFIAPAARAAQWSADEIAVLEMQYALRRLVRRSRRRSGMTQAELAAALGSSQSRVAKFEGSPGGSTRGAPGHTVSLELLIRAALAAGATRAEVNAALAFESPRMQRRGERGRRSRGTAL